MSVSPYFKHVTAKNEQSLIDDLTKETIFQRGLDLYYIPRTESHGGFDYLFGENPENIYDVAVQIEMIMENLSSGFDGADAIGRFALEIPDTATFQVSRTRFNTEVGKMYPDIKRPREGDLILFIADPDEPKVIFEITFTEDELPFYQIGKRNVYRMEAEKFHYSHEVTQTGIKEIDDVAINDDDYEENIPIQDESDTFVNFDESDPFSDNIY